MASPYHFFDKLPAELRNNIYELAFESNEVELINAAPPTKAFIMTCRQAYTEANALYKIAYRRYWQSSHFFVECGDGKEPPAAAKKKKMTELLSNPTDINHISHLFLMSSKYPGLSYGLLDVHGLWKGNYNLDDDDYDYDRWYYVQLRKQELGGIRIFHGSSSGYADSGLASTQKFPTIAEQLGCLLPSHMFARELRTRID